MSRTNDLIFNYFIMSYFTSNLDFFARIIEPLCNISITQSSKVDFLTLSYLLSLVSQKLIFPPKNSQSVSSITSFSPVA